MKTRSRISSWCGSSHVGSTTSTAGKPTSRKRPERQSRSSDRSVPKRYAQLRTAFQEQGDAGRARDRARDAGRGAEPGAGRPRAPVRLSRRLAPGNSARTTPVVDRRHPKCPAPTVRRCPSRTTMRFTCARTPRRSPPRYARCKPIRRGCIGPTLALPKSVRSGRCTRSTRTRRPGTGRTTDARPQASAVSIASNR